MENPPGLWSWKCSATDSCCHESQWHLCVKSSCLYVQTNSTDIFWSLLSGNVFTDCCCRFPPSSSPHRGSTPNQFSRLMLLESAWKANDEKDSNIAGREDFSELGKKYLIKWNSKRLYPVRAIVFSVLVELAIQQGLQFNTTSVSYLTSFKSCLLLFTSLLCHMNCLSSPGSGFGYIFFWIYFKVSKPKAYSVEEVSHSLVQLLNND